jgi:membrane associated rhomboid family serine protease
MRIMPTITKNLLIINCLVFLATYVFLLRGIDLGNDLGLYFFLSPNFHLYQLVTYMFMHGNLEHIFFNMFALWMFGRVIENVWGSKKFLFYYISCGIGAGLIQELVQYVSFQYQLSEGVRLIEMGSTVGASGAIYGVLLAFGMIFPNERIFIFPLPIPIKAKWFVGAYAFIELFSGLATSNDHVAHFAHLGGMLVGFLIIKYWQHHGNNNNYFNNYGKPKGKQFFDGMKDYWDKHSKNRSKMNVTKGEKEDIDWDYNSKKKVNQEEIDKILDKIRRSGYDSLTKDEKQKLFDSSKDS